MVQGAGAVTGGVVALPRFFLGGGLRQIWSEDGRRQAGLIGAVFAHEAVCARA